MNRLSIRLVTVLSLFVTLGATSAVAEPTMFTGHLYEVNRSGGTSKWKQTDGKIKLKQFGGGYNIGGQIWNSEVLHDKGLKAWAAASAMLFGKKSELVRIDARFAANQSEVGSLARVQVAGKTVYKYQQKAEIDVSFSQGVWILGGEATFVVGIIPITLETGVTGDVGIDFTAKALSNGIDLVVKPFVGTYAKVGAYFDAKLVKVGVTAQLTLAEFSVPVTQRLQKFSGSLKHSMRIDLVLDFLSGFIGIEYSTLNGTISGVKELFSWDGITKSWNVYNKTSTVQL